MSPTILPFPDTVQGTGFSGTYLSAMATNTGNTNITGIGSAISGTNASDFGFYSNGCGTGSGSLSPSSSCTEYVTFTPTATGPRTATLTISSANGGTQTVALSGNGLAVVNTGAATPSSLNIPTETVGTTYSNAGLVYLYATGNVPVKISSVNITGDFSIASNSCTNATTVQPGGACSLYVNFTPTTNGIRTGTLTITDTSANSPHMVTVSGTGITAAQAIQLSQTSVTFGNQAIGFASTPMIVYYSNQGTTAASFSSLTLTGPDPGDYSLTGSSCSSTTTVSAGSYCTISITFKPTAAGSRPAAVTIVDNATGSPRTISLTGTGVTPSGCQIGRHSVFLSQNVGTTSAAQSITLTNSGTGTLTFSTLAVTAPFNLTSNGCSSGSLAANTSCSLSITFAPTATGGASGTLTLTSNASSSPDQVTLTGTGASASPVVSLGVDHLTFASQNVGTTSAAQTVTLQNVGNAALIITSIAATGDFSATTTCPASPSTLPRTSVARFR